MCTVIVVVQSEFTFHDPVMVSLAKPPPTFLASVPEMFPAASILALATAAAGTGPVGRIRVPVRVSPQFPAALAFEHFSAACIAGAKLKQRAATEVASVVRANLRFMRNLLMDRIGRLPAMAKVLRGKKEKVVRERPNSGEVLPRRYIIQPLCTPEQVVDLDFRLG